MRYNYPISSQEFFDEINNVYEMQLFILGYASPTGIICTGIYDIIDASGVNTFASGYTDITSLSAYCGKIDYINNSIMEV